MPINGKPTYYEFFGLNNFDADAQAIKKAYRSMALKWHPDRHPIETKIDAERMMKKVNEVWRVLSTEKEQYDTYLKRKMGKLKNKTFTSADSFATTDDNMGTWTFDFEAVRRAHEEMMRNNTTMQRIMTINVIEKLLKRLSLEGLEQVEELARSML